MVWVWKHLLHTNTSTCSGKSEDPSGSWKSSQKRLILCLNYYTYTYSRTDVTLDRSQSGRIERNRKESFPGKLFFFSPTFVSERSIGVLLPRNKCDVCKTGLSPFAALGYLCDVHAGWVGVWSGTGTLSGVYFIPWLAIHYCVKTMIGDPSRRRC